MLLKIKKMTPRCPKRLPGDEYTGESQLPGGEYTGESRGVSTPLHQEVDFLVYYEQA